MHSSGSVCLDVINQTWTPMYELVNIFEVTHLKKLDIFTATFDLSKPSISFKS